MRSSGRSKKRLSADDIGQNLEDVKVTVSKLIYEREDFYIFSCKEGFSVKGKCVSGIVEGACYRVSGVVGTYGNSVQLVANLIEMLDDEDHDKILVADFLKENFEHIGPALAGRIAEKYGDSILEEIVEDPKSVSDNIEGLSFEAAMNMAGTIESDSVHYRIILELRKLSLSNKRAVRIYEMFGETCVDDIKRNPFILIRVPGIGFEICDSIYRKFDGEDINISRFEGAIVSAVQALHEDTGNTYHAPDVVRRHSLSLVLSKTSSEYSDESVDGIYRDALERACEDKYIVIYHFAEGKCAACSIDEADARVASRKYFAEELSVKRHIESLLSRRTEVKDLNKLTEKLLEIGEERGIKLDELQTEALITCLSSPVTIITGGPGTGKTSITSILASFLDQKGIQYDLCAPTGRASKRLSEASGVKASTIHRLLEMNATGDDDDSIREVFYGRNNNNPLDSKVVIADEASMIDIGLFKALLDALRPDASLVLIGDPEQLPSVGAGNVLEDLISCSVIPCVRLTHIFRQDEEGSIPYNAMKILNGEYPVSGEDFEIIRTESDEEAEKIVTDLVKANKDKDLAVLTPTRKRILGTEELNVRLQKSLHGKDEDEVHVRTSLVLYKGDRIMQVRNNYSIEYFDKENNEICYGIFNGEIGQFDRYDVVTAKYDILFDGSRKIGYTKKNMEDIELAYAMTVHKAQGCEFDDVVVVLGKMDNRLSNRKILYTAVTRGRNKVTIIDSAGRLMKMINSEQKIRRQTSLKDLLAIVSGRITDGDN